MSIIRSGSLSSVFLSTPSARRATDNQLHNGNSNQISIHALREEGDVRVGRYKPHPKKFLSTPSARRATA